MAQPPIGVDPHDWVTIWQSEWTAMAVDREVLEGLVATTEAWNLALAARADGSPRRPPGDAAPGSAPVGDAPSAGDGGGPAIP